MEVAPVLQRLTLVPKGGMCNRLQALASARRLCQLLHARCTVVWVWGDFEDFFVRLPEVSLVPEPREAGAKRIVQRAIRVDPARSVDVSVRSVELHSGYLFWGSHEPPIPFSAIRPFLPQLNSRLGEQVSEFSARHLQNTVGFHLRRADNRTSTRCSPDVLFLQRARSLVAAGKRIFLATDNLETERKLKTRFGDAIITRPKRDPLAQRWPRPEFNPTAAEDDLIDLFLLARTEYVVGCHGSSFTNTAIALNGSARCEKLVVSG